MHNYCISKAIFVIGIELLAQKSQKQLFKGNSGVAPMRALAPPRCPPPARPPRLHLLIPMPFRSSNDNMPVVVLIREARSKPKATSVRQSPTTKKLFVLSVQYVSWWVTSHDTNMIRALKSKRHSCRVLKW